MRARALLGTLAGYAGDAALAIGVAAGAVGILVACKNGLADDRGGAHATAPAAAPPLAPPGELSPVAPAGLCLTRGARSFDGDALAIDEPTVRAVAPASHGDAAALHFTYGGDTAEQTALASGQVRRQLGLKLRAADGCNLIYVMWRLNPAPQIEVSTKVNAGAHGHDDCGTRGYAKLRPQRAEPPPPLVAGDAHTLTAEIDDGILIARADGRVVWRGPLDDRALALRGPAGLRTDNVRLTATLHAAAGAGAPPAIPGCPTAASR